jgi:hypothetical protein
MRRDDRFRTAIHESAHCVVAKELDVPIFNVMIDHRNRGLAAIASVDQMCATHGYVRTAVNFELMICLGGPLAQKIHDGSAHDNEGDWQMIDDLRRRFDVSDARMERLKRRTRSLLLDHWGDVIRLAAGLLDAGSLDRAEIDAILK